MSATTAITTVDALLQLPTGAVVHTGMWPRTRTHSADEWDLVMSAEEILSEGGGSVKVIYNPDDGGMENDGDS